MSTPKKDPHDYDLGDIVLGADKKTLFEVVASFSKVYIQKEHNIPEVTRYRYQKFKLVSQNNAPRVDIMSVPIWTGRRVHFFKNCMYRGRDQKLYQIQVVKTPGTETDTEPSAEMRVWALQKFEPYEPPTGPRQSKVGKGGMYYYDSKKERNGGYIWRKTATITLRAMPAFIYGKKSIVSGLPKVRR
jgi:hypothetical protein